MVRYILEFLKCLFVILIVLTIIMFLALMVYGLYMCGASILFIIAFLIVIILVMLYITLASILNIL